MSTNNTFGWARAEVLGALVNSVFLMALCLTIFIEATERLTHSHQIERVDMLLYVGIGGFVVNVVGLFLFHPHRHGHAHSHGDHGHEAEDTTEQRTQGKATFMCAATATVEASV